MSKEDEDNVRYSIKDNPIAEAYRNHLFLKADSSYGEKSISAALNLINTFQKLYPEVEIEDPLLREKSLKSVLGKIRNLQIERLSKLYAIEGIDSADTNSLFYLLSARIDENIEPKSQAILKKLVRDLLAKDIENINISSLEAHLMDNDKLSSSTKSAIIRILYSKVYKSNLPEKHEILNDIDLKYGQKSTAISGNSETNFLDYSNIESIKKLQHEDRNSYDPSFLNKLERLHDEQEFLRCKDLRGMQIVIKSIPDNLQTDNSRLQNLLLQRNKFDRESQEFKDLDNKCMAILSSDFIDKLSNSEKWQEHSKMRTIRDTRKHKNKSNGYVAEHVKFDLDGNPDYTLELQVKSFYVDELSHGDGSASHAKRAGKQRIIPNLDLSLKDFIRQLCYCLPNFTVFEKSNSSYVPYNLNVFENSFKFFSEILDCNHDIAVKLTELIKSSDKNNLQFPSDFLDLHKKHNIKNHHNLNTKNPDIDLEK